MEGHEQPHNELVRIVETNDNGVERTRSTAAEYDGQPEVHNHISLQIPPEPTHHHNVHVNSSRGSVSSRSYFQTESVSVDGAHKAPILQPSHTVNDFREFIQASERLEFHLSSFTHKVQKLGSALALSIASRDFYQALKLIREYFENNAQTLGVLLGKVKSSKSPRQVKRKKRLGRHKTESQHGGSLAGTYRNELSDALDKLSVALDKFSIALTDFEDYYDQDSDSTFSQFQMEIRVLSESLAYFGSDGDSPELRRYVTARASAMRAHIDKSSVALERFIEIGIPCISFAQKRSSRMLLNASTVATFFAGVAATTLQYSVPVLSTDSLRSVDVAVNTLWFASLVLSIGSAITGMLAMTWRQAVFSSPKRNLPWYIQFWIRSGYLVLLILSVLAFLAGLVAYVYSLQKTEPSFWVILAFTTFCILGLSNVAFFFGRERWNFSKFRKEQKNPARYLYSPELRRSSWWYWWRYHLVDVLRRKKYALFSKTSSMHTFVSSAHAHEKCAPGTERRHRNAVEGFLFSMRSFVMGHSFPWTRHRERRHKSQDAEADIEHVPRHNGNGVTWNAMRKDSSRGEKPHGDSTRPSAKNTLENNVTVFERYIKQIQNFALHRSTMDSTRIKDLQFSPDGRWLVVCYKYACTVYDVQDNFSEFQGLRHIRKNAKQVEWSPDGKHLLTRVKDAVKVWRYDVEDDEFVCEKVVRLKEDLDDIQWLNDNEFLALADDSSSFFRVHVDDNRSIKGTRLPGDLTVHEMYTMIDSELIFFVATREIEGLPEEKGIDCIIVYAMDDEEKRSVRSSIFSFDDIEWTSGTIKRKIPLLEDVESLTFGTDKTRLIVSYEENPPEVWKVDEINGLIYLEEKLTIPEKVPEAEWGRAFFVGPSEQIVACAEDGIVHCWRTDNFQHFHSFNILDSDEEVEELPVISWGPSCTSPMMASGGRGLQLRIWSPSTSTKAKDDKKESVLGGDSYTEAPSEIRATQSSADLLTPGTPHSARYRPHSPALVTPTPRTPNDDENDLRY